MDADDFIQKIQEVMIDLEVCESVQQSVCNFVRKIFRTVVDLPRCVYDSVHQFWYSVYD